MRLRERIRSCSRVFFTPQGFFRAWTVPVILAGVAFLSYGLYATRLGFYWDDWTFAWARSFRGFEGLRDTFAINRPLRPYFEILLDPLLGINPLAWQVFGILTRLFGAIALWWFLRQTWPAKERVAFEVALLSLVYPGFIQQSIAMTYDYFWFFQGIFFISMGLMVAGLRRAQSRWPVLVLSWLLCALQLFSNEYFFGLELLRPAFLWVAFRAAAPRPGERLSRALRWWLPYLLILGLYLYWRVFVFQFPSYQPVLLDQLRSAPTQALVSLLKQVGADIKAVILDGWVKVVQIPRFTSRFSLLYPLVVGIGFFGILAYLARMPDSTRPSTADSREDRGILGTILVTGVIAILFAGIPFYITNLQVTTLFEFDRLTIPFWFGASLLVTALLEMFRNKGYTIGLMACLAALSIGAQLYYSMLFRNEKDMQDDFAWQLTWRAPALRPGTLLLSDDSTFPFTDDEGLSFMINWIYFPDDSSGQFPVTYVTISSRLGSSLPSLNPGVAVDLDYSSAVFHGTTDQAMILYYSPPSCLRILDPEADADLIFHKVGWTSEGLPKTVTVGVLPGLSAQALSLASLDRIITDPAQPARPPAAILGEEPDHTWCYFFEKADLARQLQDWEQVAALGEAAMVEHSLRAGDLSEYLLFLEAYLRVDEQAKAVELSEQLIRWAPSMRSAVCLVWQRSPEVQLQEEMPSSSGVPDPLPGCP